MRNEIAQLPALLEHLAFWQSRGCEVVLVDGGSTDGSHELAATRGFIVLHSAAGRARQMNAGAMAARADILLFLHADTRLPEQADKWVARLSAGYRCWGHFDVEIMGDAFMLSWIARLMNLRSRLTGIATGDQAIFVEKATFAALGGFADQPLMEDIELSSRLRRLSPPLWPKPKAITSGRRWLENGIWRTVLLMWRLRWRYWRGASPARLADEYR